MDIVRQKVITYTKEVPDDLEEFKSWRFSSGATTGKDFKRFARIFKKFIKSNLPEGGELVRFNRGHYILSGFIEKDNKFVYFSISDVRYFKNRWANEILVRTVKDPEDFNGGSNGYTNLVNFKEDVGKLLQTAKARRSA